MYILRHHLLDRYGAPGLNSGTRSRETIEREAAENCPVCKVRAAEEAGPDEAELRARAAYLEGLLKRYEAKVAYERRARLSGDVVAADFTVRQLTCIEMLLGAMGATDGSFKVWESELARIGGGADPGDVIEITDFCRLLDHARRKVWTAQGPLRPMSDPTDGMTTVALPTGEDKDTRILAQHEARMRMAEAQELWEAAATEEGWARYREQAKAAQRK